MKTYSELTVNEKINIRQYAINLWGKRWHTLRPNFLKKLNVLQINYILS